MRVRVLDLLFYGVLVSYCISGFSCHRSSGDDVKIIFLHHSTGMNVYNEGRVKEWFSDYNREHGTSYKITGRLYPKPPSGNYPFDYWNLWVNGVCNSDEPGKECMDTLTEKYNVIIFKHCYPGADILPDIGKPSVSFDRKSLENYKLQYRELRNMMDGYPDNMFVLWTLAPRHRLRTNPENATRAKQFVEWVKSDFLKEDTKSHPNIFLFDFWSIVAEDNPYPEKGEVNCLKYEYERSHKSKDSHPNRTANHVAGPLFTQFIVDSIKTFHSKKESPK